MDTRGEGSCQAAEGGHLDLDGQECCSMLRKGKQGPSHVVLGMGEELLTQTGHIMEQWKEHFEDLLSPTTMSSIEEAGCK